MAAGLHYHVRRDYEKRTQLVANLEDILQALVALDSVNRIPGIFL